MKQLDLSASVVNSKRPPKIEKTVTVIQPESTVTINKPELPKPPKENIFKRFFRAYGSMAIWKKVLLTGFICLLVLGGGGTVTYLYIIKARPVAELIIPTRVSAEAPNQTEYTAIVGTPDPNPPRDTPNPINGELFTAKEMLAMKQRYPIAIMIENHVDARPQAGFNEADLVFETLAEGGITRMMAIFWGEQPESLGPVRSARQYYVEWLMPFDPLYMHIGYAQTDDPRTNAIGTIWEYGVKTMDIYGSFWRVDDKWAPHNAYTSAQNLYDLAAQVGYTGTPQEITPWQFKKDAPVEERGTKTTATLTFFQDIWNGGLYDVTWTYDRTRNVYLRAMGTEPYIDQITGSQVYAKNIVFQKVEMISTFDEKAHIIITTIGQGDAIILRDGLVINGTWKKDDITSRTKYFDQQGAEIIFNRGVTWIEGVPIDQGVVQIDS